MSAARFAWAVIGPGRIAHRFAGALAGVPGAALAAVHARRREQAGAFAAQWRDAGRGEPVRATERLDELLSDPRIDAVYIATPHAHHAAFVRAALEAGKPVLCEKPLVPNEAQAQSLVALARERRVFLMEAVWTRYLPIYEPVGAWLREGAIGAVRAMQSSFCFHLPFDPAHRCYAPELAGGALLDIGIYNLTATRWLLAQALGACPEPEHWDARALIGPTGVDHRLHATLGFAGGVSSQFVCGFDGLADNALRIDGEHGHLTLHDGFWHSTRATLVRAGQPPVEVVRPHAVNGFEGEIAAAMAAIREGRIEEPRMPHDETLATLRWMDRLRERVGVRYPFE